MKLNMYIIAEYLSLPVTKTILHGSLSGRMLDTIGFFHEKYVNKPSLITLINEPQLPAAAAAGGSFLCAADNVPEDVPDNCDIIFTAGTYGILELYAALNDLFQEFSRLEETLYRLAAENAPFRDFGEAILPYLYNPISLFTASHRNLLNCEREKEEQYRYFADNIENQYLPDEDIQLMKFHPAFIETLTATEPEIFPEDLWGYRILYHNIRIANLYVARAMIYEIDRRLQKSDWALLEFWSQFLYYKIKNTSSPEQPSHPKDFDLLMMKLLNHELVDDKFLMEVLEEYNWKTEDYYLSIVLAPGYYDNLTNTRQSLCANLEILFPGSAALLLDDGIVHIVNLGSDDQLPGHISEKLPLFLRNNILKAGISNPCKGIMNLSDIYRQAEIALKIGSQENPTHWSYYYEQYALAAMLHRVYGGFSLGSLCPVGLLKLIQYDIDHKRSFTESLRVYLENDRNIARTVRVLFIQRSTFLYQLRRICEISGLNLKDAHTRLQLLICFELLKKNGIRFDQITGLEELNIRQSALHPPDP